MPHLRGINKKKCTLVIFNFWNFKFSIKLKLRLFVNKATFAFPEKTISFRSKLINYKDNY